MNLSVAPNSDLVTPTPSPILLVDDEPSIRRFVANLLTGFGHEASTAGGVDEALLLLAGGDYHVALIDLAMPGRTGLDLLSELQAREHPVVPILLTGSDDIAAVVSCMKIGAFDYVAKPCERGALFRAVERAVVVATARRHKRELELVVSEWAATFDACPDQLLVLDSDGRVLEVNEAAARAAGMDREGAAGRRVEELYAGELGVSIRTRQRAANRPAPDGPAVRVHDTRLDRHYLVSVTPARTALASWVVVASDVTALVRGEAERRGLLRRVLTAQEEERGRIARELHDGICQSLVSLAVGLANVEPLLGQGEGPARDAVTRLRQVATESLGEIRRLAHGLRPAVLDDLGLAIALGRKLDTFSALHRVRAELVAPDEPFDRLPREVESAAYRIVQEALANVAKHARAETIDVVLEVGDGDLRVMVTDDGIGFSPDAGPARAGGTGLAGMRERADLLGGTVRIDSVPGRGTTVDARIPIPGA